MLLLFNFMPLEWASRFLPVCDSVCRTTLTLATTFELLKIQTSYLDTQLMKHFQLHQGQ